MFSKKFRIIVLSVVIVLGCVLVFGYIFEKSHTSITSSVAVSAQKREISDSVPVVRVIDGDTIDVDMGTTTERVRFLGMDTPETVDPRKPVQCFGPEASAETKSLLENREVRLVADPSQADRDIYGRLLRYVYRDDGLFVDEFLIQQGFAREYTFKNEAYKFQSQFRSDEAAAQAARLGLWAACAN